MAMRTACIVAFALTLGGAPLRAEPPALPPMAGIGAGAAQERAELFAALKNSKGDPEAREIEAKIWKFWLGFADEESRRLLDQSHDAQLSFDYGRALSALEALVKHQPQFAEGWNQLAYVLFLAGSNDASLAALDKTLALEPMHYAALAGRGIILIQEGKDAEAQIALKKALAIDPWLKERNLIEKDH
jgi:tetratricopeptide (TPR) repeat protein